ncbi:EVE domain-containing protein [Thermococcus sp.]|uniref:EVE domain-containing protein n=1 Tax=Thermococcus sp. TaxID=35749 RepID=UPI0019A7D482|nr:EVE domain-containing protein [Thermococcus sp.]MBC7094486.1 EVE domain-containing protein [Thermococcus sp.]
MAYWLCITNRANWKVIKEKNVWGVPRRHKNTIAKVKPGDKLLIYVKQERKDKQILEPKIVGIFEVVSEPYEDSSRIFKAHVPNETYPLRVRIKPVKLGELDFNPLIPRLKFITNKKKWSGHLMGKAMREIREEDYKLIESLL